MLEMIGLGALQPEVDLRADQDTHSATKTALIGRSTNTPISPREISMARRKFSSKRGPSTKPSRIGAGWKPSRSSR